MLIIPVCHNLLFHLTSHCLRFKHDNPLFKKILKNIVTTLQMMRGCGL